MNSCETRDLDYRPKEETLPVESMAQQLLLPKEEFSLPRECSLPPSTTVQRMKMDHQMKPSNPDPFFPISTPYTVPPSNYFQTNYVPRQRSQSSEFRPPHDFSNPIWEYFTLEEDKATCKVCGKRITYRNNAYVTNLVTHLRTRGIGHDTCYNFYMMKKSESSNKVRDEIALNYLLTNMASTVFGAQQQQQQQQASGESPAE